GNRDRVSRLVAECDSQAQSQQQGEDENPEHDLGLALQFQHARHQQVGISRPAAIAAPDRGNARGLFNRSFLGYAHGSILLALFGGIFASPAFYQRPKTNVSGATSFVVLSSWSTFPQVTSGQANEDIFQACLPGGQMLQATGPFLDLLQQRGNRQVRLFYVQRNHGIVFGTDSTLGNVFQETGPPA